MKIENKKSLWNKNFMLFVLGLELQLIAKTLIRFALPLYVLIETGNPALMGMVLSISSLPLIILSPIGGALSDRFSKKKLLATMNFLSAGVILIYFTINPTEGITVIVLFIMMAIAIFESFISPTSEASIPFLVPTDQLVKANAVTFLLTNFSSIGAPVMGGFILERYGLTEVLIAIAVLYTLASVINLLVRIPVVKKEASTKENKNNIVMALFDDIKSGMVFVTKENRSIGKIIFIVFLLAVTMITTMTIAVPTLMVTYLEMPETTIGLSQGIVVFGGTLATIMLPMFKDKATYRSSRLILFIPSVIVLLAGFLMNFSTNQTHSYFVLVISFLIVQAFLTLYGIIYFAFLGEKTPPQVVGKVMGLAISSSVLGFAIGDFLHGVLFHIFSETPGIALLILGAISIFIALNAKIGKKE